MRRTDQQAYRMFDAGERAFLKRMFLDHPGIGERFDAFLALPPEDRESHAQDTLGTLPRTGWVQRHIKDPETVWEHTEALVRMAQTCPLPKDTFGMPPDKARSRLMVMAMLHDMPEAIVSDFTPHCPIAPQDKDRLELLAAHVIYAGDTHRLLDLRFDHALRYHAHLQLSIQEYIEQQTPMSQLLHDLDKLAAVKQALIYEGMYPEKRGKLYTEFRDYSLPRLKTDEGRALAAEIEANAEQIRKEGWQQGQQRKFAGRTMF